MRLHRYLQRVIHKLYLSKHNKISFYAFISAQAKMDGCCTVGHGSKILSDVHLMDNVKIGSNVHLESIKVGKNSIIESSCKCIGSVGGLITIGENVYVGIANYLDHSGDISIGNNVQIAGPSTAIYTHSGAYMALHGDPLDTIPNARRRFIMGVVIEDNVYVGCNCTIYPGVVIGHHSIVAPNSAVVKDVSPFTMVGGVPAQFVKQLHLSDNKMSPIK